MRNFHVLIKYAGSWKTKCVKKENPDKRWGEQCKWGTDGQCKGDVFVLAVECPAVSDVSAINIGSQRDVKVLNFRGERTV